jgi:DNA-binding transcriptional regulator YdaS (Cro superfamily)|tara:strand:- start:334 stop:555 length:222 start_codon:yes stop_codon:yes gene_type:complete
MYLSKWIGLTKTTKKSVAEKLGNITPTSVTRWTKSKRFPKPQELMRIEEITEGLVTANDFVKQWKEQNGQKEI